MSGLGEVLAQARGLSAEQAAHLQALVSDWQLLADLSFADLSLFVPLGDGGGFVCAAHVRPTTAPTAYPDDQVGAVTEPGGREALDVAWREGRIVREGDPEWNDGVPVREEAIPVRHQGALIGVLARDTNLSAARVPSQLELTYLRTAAELATMIAEGRFPFPAAPVELADPPRVGDGLLRLDADGMVAFASPNALSAYRRLGWSANLTGTRLRDTHAGLGLGEAAVWRVLATRRPDAGEVARQGVDIQLRALPLLPGGQVLGAVVLVRDVTELRRRERALLSKDATIREIHHRVKNNLQTVAALLRLQARRTPTDEARLALEESVRRVTSIALVHETLSQALDEIVAFDQIADEVAAMTLDLAATGGRAQVSREGSFGLLPAEIATPLALVLSELLQNAVEHAFAGSGGSLTVRVRRDDAGLEVVVADDGAGLPPDFALDRGTRLGLQIVRALVVGEMRGTLVLRPAPLGGTEAVVAVPAAALVSGAGPGQP